ncbi:MAG: glycosyltransferase family 4 protein, partial [Ktedonobacterales bacterium]
VMLRRFVPAYSNRIICVSQAALDCLLRTPPARAKGVVLPNGVAPAEWLTAQGRDEVRHELGCAPGDVLVGMIGRISPLKAPDLFVRAAGEVLRQHPHARFVLAGGTVPGQTSYLGTVERLIAASPAPDRIRLLGYRRDIPRITSALDALVVPTRGPESFSLVAAQAMLAGKPVVATNVGALCETIVDGETGILVPPDDVPALADALAALVRDAELRARMGRAGRTRALERFTLDRQIAAFNHILEEMLYSGAGSAPASVDNEMVSVGAPAGAY